MKEPTAAESPINVAFCFDNAFARPLAAALHSLIEGRGKRALRVYLVGRGVSARNRRMLERVAAGRAELRWLSASASLKTSSLKTDEKISRAAYLRLLLPELLPETCRRLIYLDVDVIVQGSLDALWEQDLQRNVLFAVRDPEVFVVSNPRGLARYSALGLAADHPYFNSGVMGIDVARWRELSVTEKTFDYLHKHREEVRLHDQDALNAVLHDEWQPVAEQWNLQTALIDGRRVTRSDHQAYLASFEEEALRAGPHIVHYTQGRKPWHPGCTHPYRHLFDHYLLDSGCFRTETTYRLWYLWRYVRWGLRKAAVPRVWRVGFERLRRKIEHIG